MTIKSKMSFARWLLIKPIALLREHINNLRFIWKHDRDAITFPLVFIWIFGGLFVPMVLGLCLNPYWFLTYLNELGPLFIFCYWCYLDDMNEVARTNEP